MQSSIRSDALEFRAEIERRRLRFVNIVATVALVLAAGYLVLYVYRGWWFSVSVQAGALLGFGLGLWLVRTGRTRVAPLVLVATALCSVTLSVNGALSAAAGNHFFLLVIMPFSFVIIHPLDYQWRKVAGGAALFAFIATEVASSSWTPPFDVHASQSELWRMRLASTVLAALFMTGVLYLFYRDAERAQRALYSEHDRSESLLLNILPSAIAERLKRAPTTIADAHIATVLFSDIVGFTQLSAVTPPGQMVDLLNRYFSEYDKLAERYGVEKIKTIGDAYMAATGVPEQHPDPVFAMVQMARGMTLATERLNRETGASFVLRIGLNTGLVTAGVIGQKKFVYDLWGDAVNVASRMESNGVPGRIQVSASVEEALRDRVSFEPRGEIEIKGKGRLPVFLVGDSCQSPP